MLERSGSTLGAASENDDGRWRRVVASGVGKVGHTLLYYDDGYLFSIGGFSAHKSVGSEHAVFYYKVDHGKGNTH